MLPDGILRGAKFTLRPSLAFYIGSIGSVTARHSSSASANLCGVVQGMELRNFSRVRHLYSAGRPSRLRICDTGTWRVINWIIFRPHRSTTYVDAAYSYRPSSVVCRSVCRSACLSVCHTSEPCKNGCTDRAAVWVEDLGGPGNHVLDGSRSPHGKGQIFFFGGGERASHCKV